MKRTVALLAGLIAAGTLAGSAAAQARPPGPMVLAQGSLGAGWREQQDEARQGVRNKRMVPLSQVIAEISRRNPGRVLDAGIEYIGDRPVYRVRWMTNDGRRMDYLVDATTGAIMSGG